MSDQTGRPRCPADFWDPYLGPCICEGRVHQPPEFRGPVYIARTPDGSWSFDDINRVAMILQEFVGPTTWGAVANVLDAIATGPDPKRPWVPNRMEGRHG